MPSFHDPFRPASARPDADSAPRARVAPVVAEEDKVPTGTVKELKAWVGDDKDRAQKILDQEQKSDEPRKGLIKDLTALLEEE